MNNNLSTTTLRVAAVAVAILWVAAVLVFAGCATVQRPDLGTKKNNGKVYEAEQTVVAGLIKLKPKWKPSKTKTQRVIDTVSAPAEFMLWVAVPCGIVTAAGFVYMLFFTGNPRTMKRLGIVAIVSGIIAVISAAVMLAALWILAIIPALIVAVIIGYRITHGKKLQTDIKFTRE